MRAFTKQNLVINTGIVAFILIIFFMINSCINKTEKEENLAINKNNLDLSTKPGDNFYQFANGNWLKSNPIPDEFSSYGSFDLIQEENYKQVLDVLTSAQKNKNATKGSIDQKIGDFYSSGMDTIKIEKLGASPLNEEIAVIEKCENILEIQNETARLHTYGINPSFNMSGAQDQKNSEMIVAYLSQGGLGLPDRDYYTNDDEHSKAIREAYLLHINKIFSLLNLKDKRYKNAAEKIMNLEMKLAKSSMTLLDQRDPYKTYNKMSLLEIQKKFNGFDWVNYFKNVDLAEPGDIIVMQPKFLEEVSKLQKSISLDDWKVYLVWNLVNSSTSYLSSDFLQEHFNFYGATLSGSKKMRERWKRVLSATNLALGEAVGQAYVKKYFPPKAKVKMLELVENLKIALESRINQLDWMTPKTKEAAIIKLKAMNVKIGYPDNWLDYSKLSISPDSYFKNSMEASNFNFKIELKKIGKPVDKSKWEMFPQTVNAYYSPNMNEIVFPAAILQPPMFFVNGDDAVNYGAIGTVIGHEMTHGFDDEGRLFDVKGNLNDWWTPEDAENFKKKTQILVDQYNLLTPINNDTLHVNGALTLGENIADLGGITISFVALQNVLKNKKVQPIDGYTQEQRFFLSYAQVWMENVREKELRRRIQEDVHSPAICRVNGVVYNLPAFYEAFQVSDKDKMYKPEKERAKIW